MSDDLVNLCDVRVELGGNSILRGVNASLARGRLTALIGLNGCGKTTLLRTILKEVPYGGRVEFHCGHDHRQQTPQHVGYVPQKLRIEANFPLTVRDLLALALQRRPLFLGVSRRTKQVIAKIIDRVGLPHELLNRFVEKISGGELQRVLLGLAMQPSPELLLLDEPAAGIDFKDQETFYDLINRLNREQHVTVLLVSHDLSVVSKHAHHVICLKDGVVECQGAPDKIVSREVLRQTFGAETAIYAHHHHDTSR
jgi:ABC-type Mn2+/Zn2+ transport system ATPase subunit